MAPQSLQRGFSAENIITAASVLSAKSKYLPRLWKNKKKQKPGSPPPGVGVCSWVSCLTNILMSKGWMAPTFLPFLWKMKVEHFFLAKLAKPMLAELCTKGLRSHSDQIQCFTKYVIGMNLPQRQHHDQITRILWLVAPQMCRRRRTRRAGNHCKPRYRWLVSELWNTVTLRKDQRVTLKAFLVGKDADPDWRFAFEFNYKLNFTGGRWSHLCSD